MDDAGDRDRMVAALQWAEEAMRRDDSPTDSLTRRAEVQKHLLGIEMIYQRYFGIAHDLKERNR